MGFISPTGAGRMECCWIIPTFFVGIDRISHWWNTTITKGPSPGLGSSDSSVGKVYRQGSSSVLGFHPVGEVCIYRTTYKFVKGIPGTAVICYGEGYQIFSTSRRICVIRRMLSGIIGSITKTPVPMGDRLRVLGCITDSDGKGITGYYLSWEVCRRRGTEARSGDGIPIRIPGTTWGRNREVYRPCAISSVCMTRVLKIWYSPISKFPQPVLYFISGCLCRVREVYGQSIRITGIGKSGNRHFATGNGNLPGPSGRWVTGCKDGKIDGIGSGSIILMNRVLQSWSVIRSYISKLPVPGADSSADCTGEVGEWNRCGTSAGKVKIRLWRRTATDSVLNYVVWWTTGGCHLQADRILTTGCIPVNRVWLCWIRSVAKIP